MHLTMNSPRHQSGISLIAAIFMLVTLAMLGALMTVLISSQSLGSLNEWYSSQALYAAESGVQASAYKINHSSGATPTAKCADANTSSPVQVESGTEAWYSITSTLNTINSINVCEIVATGLAGGTSANPTVQRQITVTYSSIAIR